MQTTQFLSTVVKTRGARASRLDRRHMRHIFPRLLLSCLILTMNNSIWADGWIEVDSPSRSIPIVPTHPSWLSVRNHVVDIEITGGFAEVILKKSFHNSASRSIEGTFYFPIPQRAYVEDFRLKMNNQELAGEVLPAVEARRIYESLVRQAVDPAILEYYRQDLFRARVFPIPANEDVEITLSYRQRVPSNGGLTRFTYPLSSGHFAHGISGDLQINVDIKTDARLHSAHSPSHPCQVIKQSQYGKSLQYSAKQSSVRHDFLVDILEGDGQLAAGVRAYRASSDKGWFVLRLVPGQQPQESLPPATLVLLVDVSGSMAGEKLDHAKAAIRSALARLRPSDRFQILAYSSRVSAFASNTVFATADNLSAATQFVERLTAKGGTNIDEAVREGLAAAKAEELVATVLLITDGRPTVGVVAKSAIVNNSVTSNGGDHRLHVLGIGADVNTILLDELARKNRGSRTYIKSGDKLEVSLNAVLDRALYPALTNIVLEIEGISIEQVEPPGPWDLFHGDELVLAGRYDGNGSSRVGVTGQLAGARLVWSFPAEFPQHGGAEEAAYLWAEFRITTLLEILRESDATPRRDIVDEVVALSLRYGIVTPFTSYLIQESPNGVIANRIADRVYENKKYREQSADFKRGFYAPSGEESLGSAVAMARQRRNLGQDLSAAGMALREDSNEVLFNLELTKTGGMTLIRTSEEQDTLVDTSIGTASELPKPDIVISFMSAEYLHFLSENPGVEKILSSGNSLLFRWKDSIIKIEENLGPPTEGLEQVKKAPVRL